MAAEIKNLERQMSAENKKLALQMATENKNLVATNSALGRRPFKREENTDYCYRRSDCCGIWRPRERTFCSFVTYSRT